MKPLAASIFAVVLSTLSCAKPQKCPEPVAVDEYKMLTKYAADWVCFEAEGKCVKSMIKNIEKK